MTLVTGTPGAGKTVRLLQEALAKVGITNWSGIEDLKKQYADQGRMVVAVGIDGLIDGLFSQGDSTSDWQDYPDGTLFVVDEAWKWWAPKDEQVSESIAKKLADAESKGHTITPPPHWDSIPALAEHRHRGFDFIYTTQMPSQLCKTVKALTDRHLHVTRKFNTAVTVVYEWPSVVSNPNSQAQRLLAQESDWIHPAKIFELYKSASIHNMKRRIPWKVYMLPVVAALGLACVIGAIYALSFFFDDPVAEAAGAVGAPATQGTGSEPQAIITPEQYLASYLPRIPSQPWSAPIYDSLKPEKAPRLFCMSSHTSCSCMTEQGTRWQLDDSICRTVARWGQYEPLHEVEVRKKDREPRRGSDTLHAPPRNVDLTPSSDPTTELQRTAVSSGPLPNVF